MIYIQTFWIVLFTLFGLMAIRYKYLEIEDKENFFVNVNSDTKHKLKVKKAIDLELGLMYRKEPLKPGTGLLFDYGRYGIFSFWMKNTYIPLEIICLDHEYHVIGFIKNMIPQSKKSRSLDKPFRYAIEVNNGYSNKKNIKIGDTLELKYINTL